MLSAGHADRFRFDGAEVIRANLREQVAWTQPPGADDTAMLAADYVRMAITQARKSNLPVPYDEAPYASAFWSLAAACRG